MQTGSIIDFYDDPHGQVLKEKVASADLPDYIKEAQHLDQAVRDRLPDEAFAVVMFDRGEKIRKYACVDKGNTALSTLYFMENSHKLPEEAQKVAAANLVRSCEHHGLDVPLQLVKAASMIDPAQKALRRALAKLSPSPENLGKAEKIVRQLTPESKKVMKQWTSGRLEKSKGMLETFRKMTKKSSVNPYVDITGQQPPPRFEKVAHTRFCLVKEGQGRFPIDSYGDVLEANQWFEENGNSLHPADRKEYCEKLAARADEIGIAVTDRIRKYASQDFAPDGEIRVAVATRQQFWADDSPERDMLDGLMGKYASVDPGVFCEALRQFDEATGLDHHWDDAIYDPWYSTYGFEKQADKVWDLGTTRLTSGQLKDACTRQYESLKRSFGEEMANELRAKPEQIFDSLPLDSKRIIARMANDPQ